MVRKAQINRETNETKIKLSVDLNGTGKSNINTGVGFFNHMLQQLAFHSGIEVEIEALGDLDVCDHHLVEDVGIALGKALAEALGNKLGINRYGTFFVPMDEALAMTSIDISGRPYLYFECDFVRENIGTFSTEMVKEFFRALALNAGMTIHLKVMYGENDHHKAEALFKSFGRALKEAIKVEGEAVSSTKGVL